MEEESGQTRRVGRDDEDGEEESACLEDEEDIPPNMSQLLCSQQSTNDRPQTVEFNDFIQKRFTALDFQDHFLSTGCPVLDKGFNGGIPCFGLTEFAGQAASGKSQLCIQLCLTVQLPKTLGGLSKGAVYISTENIFPSKRLKELTYHLKSKFKDNLPDEPMSNIMLEHVSDAEALIVCVTKNLPRLLREKPIGLIILDSVAAIFRSEYEGKGNAVERSRDIRLIGRALHDIAYQEKIPLVVVNQITANISVGEDIPSLGMTWKNLVTTRIQFIRKNEKRRLQILFSPYIPVRTIPFIIESTGVRYLQPS